MKKLDFQVLSALAKKFAPHCRQTVGALITLMWNAMIKFSNGFFYVSSPDLSKVVLKATETDTGHLEFKAYHPWKWESKYLHPDARDYMLAQKYNPALDEERRERSIKSAAARAKNNIRLACKSINADTLLTLTYRENQTDLATCKAHVKEFVRRVHRVIPSFAGVVGFERQSRGAWHVHVATRAFAQSVQRVGVRVKSFDLLRSIWRSVASELGGNVDVSTRKKHSRKTPAMIAGYISKYLTKAYDELEKFVNRWTKYGAIPAAQKFVVGEFATLKEAVLAAYTLVPEKDRIASGFIIAGETFFLASERVT